MGRQIYLVATLAVFTPAAVGAGGFHDADKLCTAGSLRACGSSEVGFAEKEAKLPQLVVKTSDLLSPSSEKAEFAAALFPEKSEAIDKWTPTEKSGPSLNCTTEADCAMVTPEPVTVALLGTGLAGIAGVGVLRRRRRT